MYVGSDGKLHFVDSEGVDSVLPFSGMDLENPLWINTNTMADEFRGQTISLDLSKCTAVLVKCKYFYAEADDGRTSMTFCEVGKSSRMTVQSDTNLSARCVFTARSVTVTKNSVVFTDSFKTDSNGYPYAYCIPLAIYGIK